MYGKSSHQISLFIEYFFFLLLTIFFFERKWLGRNEGTEAVGPLPHSYHNRPRNRDSSASARDFSYQSSLNRALP
ncbi:hypothetical protein LR48_Vigan10g146500 [Vigna angularis]|uniref:Uncharacterized protein n=1 Tax=Phaseolus angularis TaxID=3914 RepID=A0A0L9VKS2_PHAAN|nr:hypothetical protein LR48_Vigan10g146500 [Vigna angularis]